MAEISRRCLLPRVRRSRRAEISRRCFLPRVRRSRRAEISRRCLLPRVRRSRMAEPPSITGPSTSRGPEGENAVIRKSLGTH